MGIDIEKSNRLRRRWNRSLRLLQVLWLPLLAFYLCWLGILGYEAARGVGIVTAMLTGVVYPVLIASPSALDGADDIVWWILGPPLLWLKRLRPPLVLIYAAWLATLGFGAARWWGSFTAVIIGFAYPTAIFFSQALRLVEPMPMRTPSDSMEDPEVEPEEEADEDEPMGVLACAFCDSTEDVVITKCCGNVACPDHRIGTGSISDGFCCNDHPFGT